MTTSLHTDELHKVFVEEQKVLKSQVPLICRSLSLYLANEETEHILFRPCRVRLESCTSSVWGTFGNGCPYLDSAYLLVVAGCC